MSAQLLHAYLCGGGGSSGGGYFTFEDDCYGYDDNIGDEDDDIM